MRVVSNWTGDQSSGVRDSNPARIVFPIKINLLPPADKRLKFERNSFRNSPLSTPQMSRNIKLVIRNLEQVVQVTNKRELFKCGDNQDSVDLIQRDAKSGVGAFVAVDSDGLICGLGHDDDAKFRDILSRGDY